MNSKQIMSRFEDQQLEKVAVLCTLANWQIFVVLMKSQLGARYHPMQRMLVAQGKKYQHLMDERAVDSSFDHVARYNPGSGLYYVATQDSRPGIIPEPPQAPSDSLSVLPQLADAANRSCQQLFDSLEIEHHSQHLENLLGSQQAFDVRQRLLQLICDLCKLERLLSYSDG